MSQLKSISTEQSILESAEKLFLDKGYAKTSTTAIASLAGCNQALVHYYYRSKENLFRTIFENKAKMFVSSLFLGDEEQIPFEEKMKKRISTHFEMVKANKKLPVLLFNEIATNTDLAEKLVQNIGHLPLDMVAKIQLELDDEFEKGTICKTDAKTLLFQIFSSNVMTFLSAPLFKLLVQASDEQFEHLLEKRKAENIKFILKSLKP